MDKLRTATLRALRTAPIYRLLPRGQPRHYAAVQYLAASSSAEVLCNYVEDSAVVASATQRLSTALLVARAAFRLGEDVLAQETLSHALRRFPEESELHVIQADLDAFRGDLASALSHAQRARILEPDSDAATARALRMLYARQEQGPADTAAVQAVRRFPRSLRVLWAACKQCHTADQFERLFDAWRDTLPNDGKPSSVERVLPALATAAARSGLVDTAIDLCAQAMLLRLDGVNATRKAPQKRLRGKSAWRALEDAGKALEEGGIPFFFAAGTALGLIREGRPLDHDDDVDIGVFEQHWDRERILELFVKHPMFTLDVSHPRHNKIYLRHRGGASMDIWRFYEDRGKFWHDGLFVRWGTSPFSVRKRTISRHAVFLPDDEDRYLTDNYGDWRTPVPGFDAFTDAPNVEVTWPEYLDLHRVRRAHHYLSALEVRAALRQLAHAQQALRRTTSGARLLDAVGL